MDNLLFYTLLIILFYYFYLPAQKTPLTKPLTSERSTQTDPLPETNPRLAQLETELAHKEQTLQELTSSSQTKIRELQAQIRDLAQRPLKPTRSQSTQTDELTQALDNLIKDLQDLNNSL